MFKWRVSPFTFEPTNIMNEPIIMFAAKTYAVNSSFTLDRKCIATKGDHEPIIKPPLYAKPDAVFLTSVGNLSERNAGMGPKDVEATNTSTPVKNIFSVMLSDW